MSHCLGLPTNHIVIIIVCYLIVDLDGSWFHAGDVNN